MTTQESWESEKREKDTMGKKRDKEMGGAAGSFTIESAAADCSLR